MEEEKRGENEEKKAREENRTKESKIEAIGFSLSSTLSEVWKFGLSTSRLDQKALEMD